MPRLRALSSAHEILSFPIAGLLLLHPLPARSPVPESAGKYEAFHPLAVEILTLSKVGAVLTTDTIHQVRDSISNSISISVSQLLPRP